MEELSTVAKVLSEAKQKDSNTDGDSSSSDSNQSDDIIDAEFTEEKESNS